MCGLVARRSAVGIDDDDTGGTFHFCFRGRRGFHSESFFLGVERRQPGLLGGLEEMDSGLMLRKELSFSLLFDVGQRSCLPSLSWASHGS